MPTVKDLLRGPLGIPKGIEAGLPNGVPKISALVNGILTNLPDGPALPSALSPLGTTPEFPKITEFIRSVESNLPLGLPKIARELTPTGEGTPPAPAKAPGLVFE